ncbi:nitrate reductase molybdenum cofactor assembly chaperone [Neisseriaceae bacterium TC5R-5]|nr:nitrate reductase molybdenum cofactor assembly chaperone [Neisseriaceae bacterium TC5R-5]
MIPPLVYRALAVLLLYPERELLVALPDIRQVFVTDPDLLSLLEPLLQELASSELISLQENYVQTFDRNPKHALHLFEHIHGEDRARGQAMVDLLAEYQRHGFEPVCNELPDYVPLFLEFLSLCEPDEAQRLLGEAIHVLAHLANRLSDSQSPYAGVLSALLTLSPVQPQALTVPPIRDMDEAMETFGPGLDGVEPLLQPGVSAIAPIHFYSQRPSGSH